MTLAIDWVAKDLMPFVRSHRYHGAKFSQVICPEDHIDPEFPRGSYRPGGMTLALASVVAIYLSQPNRGDHDALGDGERLHYVASQHREVKKRVLARALKFQDERHTAEADTDDEFDALIEGK